jgi:hypothetical protein
MQGAGLTYVVLFYPIFYSMPNHQPRQAKRRNLIQCNEQFSVPPAALHEAILNEINKG